MSPNAGGPNGRIVLIVPRDRYPSPAPNAVTENLIYSGWLYAAVETNDGSGDLKGIFMTKDNGQNWVQVLDQNALVNVPGFQAAIPDGNGAANVAGGSGNYDVTASPGDEFPNFDITLAVDPTDPSVIYVGGLPQNNSSGLIRLDTTNIADAHAFNLGDTNNDGGLLQMAATGPATVNSGQPLHGNNPVDTPVINLIRTPFNVLDGDGTVVVNSTNGFSNSGNGVTWIPFDIPGSGGNQHRIVTTIDPTTGLPRLIIGDDSSKCSPALTTTARSSPAAVAQDPERHLQDRHKRPQRQRQLRDQRRLPTPGPGQPQRQPLDHPVLRRRGPTQQREQREVAFFVEGLPGNAGLLYGSTAYNGQLFSPSGILTTAAGEF